MLPIFGTVARDRKNFEDEKIGGTQFKFLTFNKIHGITVTHWNTAGQQPSHAHLGLSVR